MLRILLSPRTGAVVALLVALGFPLLTSNDYYLLIATDAGIAAVLAISLGLLYGYTGQLSLAQGAFYGIGAYTSVLLDTRLGVPFEVALLASMAAPAIVAFVVGIPTLRLHGNYLAIATLALQVSISEFFTQATGLTNGTIGIFGISRHSFAGISLAGAKAYYEFVAVAAVVSFVVAHRVVRSRFGRALSVVREDETLAATVGINPGHYKVVIFSLSAAMAGLAGTLYAYQIQFISPVTFDINQSILVLSMVVIGGLASNAGAVAGAIIVTVITQVLFSAGDFSFLIYGAWIIAVMLFFPAGLAGIGRQLLRLLHRFAARGAPAPAVGEALGGADRSRARLGR
jgi:branched-chain amino acid transport system permease protein